MSGKFSRKSKRRSTAPVGGKKLNSMEIVMILLAVALTLVLGVMIWLIQSGAPDPVGESTGPATSSTNPSATGSDPAETQETTAQTSETEAVFEPIDLGQGLIISELAAYTGAYMEDGTNEVVSGVLMGILENTSDQALQYARITLHYGEDKAEFAVTNIPAGARVVLLEQNRMEYVEVAPDSSEIQDVLFLPEFEMYEDIFEITGEKGNLTVKNISDDAITGDIYVYYKNSSQDLLYGGITYRARLEGGLEPGESQQIIAAHYNPTGSIILMVTYIP